MRAAALILVAVVLAGCPLPPNGDCQVDDDCSGSKVCARNGDCLAQSDVRAVRVTWTIRGQAPTMTSCSTSPNFYILFASHDFNDSYGYEPVPCASGVFSVDKLPTKYYAVEIGVDGRFSQEAVFDSQGQATLDLMP
jgi:hypothetical protein